MPHVVRVQWEPDDHVAELSRMLQGVAPRHVERQLVQYVENKIEPAGWKAVWTIPQNLPDSVFTLKQETCVYVDVIDVSQEKLIAEVKVLRPVISDILKEDFQVIEEGKNNMVQVPLMQLSVLADQENEALDMVSTAEVICQIKFFYEHIWQPWDSEEENIRYDQSLITSRLKLYQDIQAARIPTAVGACLKAIIRDANSAEKKIQHIESKSEEKGMDYEMDQKDVAQLFKLHKQLEKLKSQFYMLKDPILREIAVHPSQEEETNIQGPHAKMKVVAHALTTVQMMKHMAMLSDLITSLPQVTDEDLWQTHTTLQNAINGAHEGDVIILLPGQHTLYQLGYLFAKCGALVGLGEGVVVEGNSENGDVLMDITGNFTIQNITLKPAPNQIGIVQHSGLTTLEKVTLTGGRWGLLGLGNAQFSVSQVCAQSCSGGGMDFRDGAVVNISASSIKNCRIGIQVEEGAKVSLANTRIEGNKKYGVLHLLSAETESSKYHIYTDELLACLQNGSGNTVAHNGGDNVAIMTAGSPRSSEGSNSTGSSPASSDDQEVFTNSGKDYSI
ncbi:SHC SH2 domain-binding protein 1 B [Chionoecetes opilio]|uniref:SHC SH2 domain-binding protein 1 B n=1 Tax=Chionoecetes opilio TaxID=41210 RepID=A0A8J4YBD4_CHIOP|nr:SHC SH2 domain-binding protein 1 B [Chionoecetes opilio]